ncbi:hypothetical protein P170DRAFT_461412 [Aspergillus steynii IBT 23096]|uniref:Uncharacterized protein n=1 Tax=Aspergillus steynii IBT 23096 TaxID=1392250 RepID=A0A2I2GRS6_9EURO|nr:uncharacterized protein P170DRAFT_461412 [Aspergillus steynii IBT 23096]PLB55576.1 hypothetical protein P170DRAFT_461412 [Aspergillus steynii IBT 23096]
MESLPSAKPVARKPERKDRRQKLKLIRKRIDKLGNGYLEDSDLIAAGVDRQPMSLEDNDILLPQFFAPYNAKVDPPDVKVDPDDDDWITENFPSFDELDFDEFAHNSEFFLHMYIQHGGLPQEDEFPPAPSYRDWGDFGFPDLVEIFGNPRWQLQTAWDLPLRPHIKCMIITEAVPDDRLLYGEIVTIDEIIQQRLRTKITRKHVDAPVLMFSFIGSQVRVLEANFNGKELVVRATKLYDLKDDDKKGWELSIFLKKWWLGDATKKSTR